MKIITTISEMQSHDDALRKQGRTIGLVPTMGFLHEGHVSLMRRARQECDVVVVSIFVNPTQFGPNEDLDRYPRDDAGDRSKCEAAGVNVLFMPTAAGMYPDAPSVFVTVEGISDVLEGAVRPGHFRGVATVVAKLFNIVKPHKAFFGQKDYQQCAVIRRMVKGLDMDVDVEVLSTVREPDGLAMSSRNSYLSPRSSIAPCPQQSSSLRQGHGSRKSSGTRFSMSCVTKSASRSTMSQLQTMRHSLPSRHPRRKWCC